MRYAVSLDKSAARFLLRLRDAKLKARLDEAIESLANEPRPPGCRKLAGTSDRYRIRIGDYRIVYRIDDGKVTVLVLVIGHRREVYDG
ncbi:MAG: type II toxin-antitoxin system RelE family toxin [Chthoniobacterales bacterium]